MAKVIARHMIIRRAPGASEATTVKPGTQFSVSGAELDHLIEAGAVARVTGDSSEETSFADDAADTKAATKTGPAKKAAGKKAGDDELLG